MPRHYREAGPGRRGSAQQNVRDSGGGKTIVAVAPKETDAVSLGFTAASRSPPILTAPRKSLSAVRALASNPNKLKAMGEAARAAAPDYDRAKELQKFVEILDA